MLNFKNKVVIITGGTRGIGFETAKAFLEKKANVIILGSKPESVVSAINKLSDLGHTADGYYPNLNNYEEVEKLFNEIVKKYGCKTYKHKD